MYVDEHVKTNFVRSRRIVKTKNISIILSRRHWSRGNRGDIYFVIFFFLTTSVNEIDPAGRACACITNEVAAAAAAVTVAVSSVSCYTKRSDVQ